MTALIRYHLRLGDVVRCLALAQHLARQGAFVYVECMPIYHGIFAHVTYARPVVPGHEIRADRVFDLQIWPARYDAFRASGLPWWEFVTGLYPEFRGLPMRIEFDALPTERIAARYGLPDNYALLCPFGYSQMHPVPIGEFMRLRRRLWSDCADVVLADPAQRDQLLAQGWPPAALLTAELSDLPAIIRDARHLLTINSAPDIIASAVRTSWHKIPEGNAQDDVKHPGQIIAHRIAA